VIALLIFFGTANNGLCQSDPTFLGKGESAPYAGLLFTEGKANDIRRDLLELDKQRLLLETEKHRGERLGQIINLKDSEIELYQKQNERLLKVNGSSSY